MAAKKETVKTKDEKGNELVLDVKYPSGKVLQDASIIYSTHWAYLAEGDEEADPPRPPVKVRRQIDEMLEEKGIWTQKEKDLEKTLKDHIIEVGRKLVDPKFKKTKPQGREMAVDILRTRGKLRELYQQRNNLDANSAEALAENVRFDYLVSACTVYNKDGEPFFKDYDDYVSRRDEQAAWDAASKMATMVYGGVDFSENFADNLIEVKFLKEFGFADKEGNFVKDGKKVDIEGNELREGEDVFGNKIKDGKVEFVFGGFEDEEPTPAPVKAAVAPKTEPKE